MKISRRAACTRSVLQLSLGAAVATATLSAGVLFALVSKVARRVVYPSPRRADTKIIDLHLRAQTITLSRTPDTQLPGRYGLFTTGTVPYLKLGGVVSETATTVTRKLLTEVDGAMRLARDAAFSGWYYASPEELRIPFRPELVGTSLGPAPAWIFPGTSDTWVIQVHGRGAKRAECLRAVPALHGAGVTSMVVSYRNDGEGPRSRDGRYGLGDTEWRDVDAAIGYARANGARRVVLMGWSMGGAIAMQTLLRGAHREMIAGVILESPVIDWREVLAFQTTLVGLPRPLGDAAVSALGFSWAARAMGTGTPVPFDALDMVARAGELDVPVLILHSDDDGYVPAGASHALAQARPDRVRLESFEVARHTKLWNYDQPRWDAALRGWIDELAD